ncbi:MAG: PP2C family protein-serine/threonine phosphatase [Chloroflexota bacterium]
MQESWLDKIALKLRPELDQYEGLERAGRLLDMSSLLGTLPFCLFVLLWLVLVSDFSLLWREWLLLAGALILLVIFQRYSFEMRLPMSKSAFASAQGSLEGMISVSAAFIFGPTAVLLPVITAFASNFYRFRQESRADARWGHLRNFVQNVAMGVGFMLVGLTVYEWLGGTYPLPGLSWAALWPALAAIGVSIVTGALVILPFGYRMSQATTAYQSDVTYTPLAIVRFLLIATNLSSLAYPFAVLAAGLYTLFGVGIYLYFILGALLASTLAARLSQSVKFSEQRSRELANLEALGRSIIDAPPDDVEHLPDRLAEHLEGMIIQTYLYIWLEPDQSVYQTPHWRDEPPKLAEVKQLVRGQTAVFYKLADVGLPGEVGSTIKRRGLAVPIALEDGVLRGGIYLLKREDIGEIMDHLTAVQSLAALIASALHRVEVYEQTVEHEKMSRELEVAGRIQASFLPGTLPQLEGWSLEATLLPARQTSGDFYDFVELGNGRLGIIVADVADKGTGAALYMALSRTLIRTYTMQYPDNPETALQLANERILEDTQSDQFVTVFLGVLTLATGQLVYANAGHNPAYLFNGSGKMAPQLLSHTGIPLGMFEAMNWRQNQVQLAQSDMLVVYTDGVTEAQNGQRAEFGEERMVTVVEAEVQNGRSAQSVAQQLITAVHAFVGDAPQFDDITLLVLQRV